MEAINLAALWRAPVIFLCENNDAVPYDVRSKSQLATDRLAGLVQPYDLMVGEVDGSDFEAVFGALGEAVDGARLGDGPRFLEVRTYGWPGQSGPRYRLPPALRTDIRTAWQPAPADEFSEWREYDPLLRFARRLIGGGEIDTDELEDMQANVLREVQEAVEFARESPYPEPAAAYDHLYA
jgi:pyruvate dehydrogenase E1 component alpha subunit